MTTPNYSFVLSAQLVSSTAVSVGNVVIPSDSVAGRWVVATTANRGTRRSEAIALTAYGGSSVGSIQLQQAGTIDAAISGLAAGSASWVRCSATGTIERCTPSGSDDIIGYAEADGRVHLLFGLFNATITSGSGGATPGGTTGSIQANDGAGGLVGYSNVLLGSGFISVGADPATTGAIRLSDGEYIYSRNQADTNDRKIIGLTNDGSRDVIAIGSNANATVWIGGTTGHDVLVGGDDFEVRNGAGSQLWFWVDGSVSACKFVSAMPWVGADGTIFFHKIYGATLAASRQLTLPTLTSDDTFVFQAHTQTLTNKTILGSTGASSAMGALAIDWSVANVFTKTLAAGGNTITFSNSADGQVIIVILTGAASTVTWPSVEWAGGVAPTQTASGVDVYTFIKAGSTIYGSVVQAMA